MGVLSWSEIGERLDAERKRSEAIRRSAWAWKQRCLDAEQRCARVEQLAHQWPKPGMELLELQEQNLMLRQERDELKSRVLENGKAAVTHVAREMEHLQEMLEHERVKNYSMWSNLQEARKERGYALAEKAEAESWSHHLSAKHASDSEAWRRLLSRKSQEILQLTGELHQAKQKAERMTGQSGHWVSVEHLEHSLDQANLTIVSLREELEKTLEELEQSKESSQLLRCELKKTLNSLVLGL